MKCPLCKSKLVISFQGNYTTASGTYTDAYQCHNTSCHANSINVVWIEDGDYFIENSAINKDLAIKVLTSMAQNKNLYALQSFFRSYANMEKKKSLNSIIITLFNRKIIFSPIFKYIEKKNVFVNTFRLSINVYKINPSGAEIMISAHHIFS